MQEQALKKSEKTVIIGARGYAGVELARLLLRHPHAELVACLSTSDTGWKLSDSLPDALSANGNERAPVLALDLDHLPSAQVFFLATPADASHKLAPQLLKLGKKVIDLSGAFRLDSLQGKDWYGLDAVPGVSAHYGLVPWAQPAVRGQLIANPGCYATSVLMAILPLLKTGLVQPDTLVIDAKSGTTGGGRKAVESLLFSEVEGECLPYKVGKHQHLPEIIRYAQQFAGVEIDPIFTTHLLPTRRGILSSIYARLAPGLTGDKALASIDAAYQHAYGQYRLVSASSKQSLMLRHVVGSARTHIGYAVQGDKLHLFSLIDNLLKGAASQAVENLNRLADRPAETGLLSSEGVL